MIVLGLAGVAYLAHRLVNGQNIESDMQALPVLRTRPVVEGPGGHGYQYVAAPNISWKDARAAAERRHWHDMPGYLATIDSRAEFDFVAGTVFRKLYPDVTYLGGYQRAPGEWRWVTGPDGAADGGKGKLFWQGYKGGRAPDGSFADWMATAFNRGGRWDVGKVCCVTIFSYHRPQFSTALGNGDHEEGVAGYLVEYGN